mgnify:FL=1
MKSTLLFLFIFVLSPNIILANTPYVKKNACPFECCLYGKWTAKSPIKIYQKERNASDQSIVQSLKPGDTFTAIKGNVYTDVLGSVEMTQDHLQFKKGDTVFILLSLGEGFFEVKHLNKTYEVEAFWSGGGVLVGKKNTDLEIVLMRPM